MPSTEEQVKSIILKHEGSAHKQQIARELNLGLDYIDFVCRDLERKGEIVFSRGSYSVSVPKSSKKISPKIHHDVKQISFSLSDIPEMTADLIDVLKREGYATIESLAEAPLAKLVQAVKLEVHEAARLINHARNILGEIKDNEVVEEEPRTRASPDGIEDPRQSQDSVQGGQEQTT